MRCSDAFLQVHRYCGMRSLAVLLQLTCSSTVVSTCLLSVSPSQPRRISAISLAERVAFERCETVGDICGYFIRLESAMSAATRLMFCTTGVLLRQLTAHPHVPGVTHIILDEVHERDM